MMPQDRDLVQRVNTALAKTASMKASNPGFAQPRFRTEGRGLPGAKVFLQCSFCGVDIRELGRDESIRVDRGYYCEKHDPGFEVPNDPVGG